jgi:hypothetical protein
MLSFLVLVLMLVLVAAPWNGRRQRPAYDIGAHEVFGRIGQLPTPELANYFPLLCGHVRILSHFLVFLVAVAVLLERSQVARFCCPAD